MTIIDNRQSRQRSTLDQISTSNDLRLDCILNLINDELTPPCRIKASVPSSLTIAVDAPFIQTLDGTDGHGRRRTMPAIKGIVPSFTSASIVFPSAHSGTITVTPGTNSTLNCPSGQVNKVVIVIDSNGTSLRVLQGTPGATEALALMPDLSSIQDSWVIGYVVVSNIGGTVQNITNTNIYQIFSDQGAISHIDATSKVHGLTTGDGNVVGTSKQQVLTNKDYDGGTASNNSRLTLPKAAYSTLSGLTRKAGTIWFDTTANIMYLDNGSILVALSGDVNGAASSTDNAFVRWDGTSGKHIKDSPNNSQLDDSGNASFLSVSVAGGSAAAGKITLVSNTLRIGGNATNGGSLDVGTTPILSWTSSKAEFTQKLVMLSSPHQFYPNGSGLSKQIINLPGGASYINAGTGQTGSYLITLPNNIDSTLKHTYVRVVIKGFDYNSGKEVHLIISGVCRSDSQMWINYSVIDRGYPLFTTVRLGEVSSGADTGKPVIILGTNATSTNYPNFIVESFEATYSGAATLDYSTGWSFTGPFNDVSYSNIDIEQTITPTRVMHFGDSILIADGSVANPSLAFLSSGNTNTGLFLKAADTLGFSANGTDLGSFSATGWIWGFSNNTPYSSSQYNITNANITSQTPSSATDMYGAWRLSANTYSGTVAAQPTRLANLSGASIALMPRAANVSNVISFNINQIADTATTTETLALACDGSAVWKLGPVAALVKGGTLTTINPARLYITNTEYNDIVSSGLQAHGTIVSINNPTISALSSTTYTNATTLYIGGAPIAGTGVTISNPWAIYVSTGKTCFAAPSNQLVLSTGVNALTINSGTSTAARTYTIPDVGATADFVMTAGNQTIAGTKTFSVGSIILNTSTNAVTISSGTSTAARTYTIPDVGATADFVMTAGNQTIAGTKTFSSTVSGSINGNAATASAVATSAEDNTNGNRYITFVDNQTGNNALKTDTNLIYNSSTNTLTAGTFSGALSGNATSATNATNTAITADTTNADRYITFVDATSGNLPQLVDTDLKYNPSSNTLTAGTFSGSLSGNVTGNCSGSSGSCTGNAATVTNGVYTSGDQTIGGNKTFSGTTVFQASVSTSAGHKGGWGLVPVGTIVAYNPGYYTATANGGTFTITGPATNDIAGINTYINTQGWYVCNGAAVNNAASPIWNAANRYLPDITGSRFLMGSTSAGTVGGSNKTGNSSVSWSSVSVVTTFTQPSVPSHYHNISNGAGISSQHDHNVWHNRSAIRELYQDYSGSGSNYTAINSTAFNHPSSVGSPLTTSGVSIVSSLSGTVGPYPTTGITNGDASFSTSGGAASFSKTTMNSDQTAHNHDLIPIYLSTFFIIRVF